MLISSNIIYAEDVINYSPSNSATKITPQKRVYLPQVTIATLGTLIFANINPTLTAIVIGGGLGALSRYGVSLWVNDWVVGTHNGTFAVNILGSFLFGTITGLVSNSWINEGPWLDFMTTGFLGAFTTFSTLTNDAVFMAREDGIFFSALYVGASVATGLAALLAGESVGNFFFP